jgi:hypothetical protein
MATLYNTKISATYPGLIKTTDNAALTATLKELTDGSGNASGLYANTAGDFKVTAILEWGSLKDTGTGVTITQWVTAADGVENFNNDTSVPTSAAVKTYVDAVVTASDLDFLGDTNTGTPAVDLDSQNFSIIGTANEIVTSGAAQTLTIGLPTSVTISDTFTGATFVGDLNGTINTLTTATTQTAGDNSTKVATTAYVDTLDAASDLDFSGDSGTGDVNLNTESLAITGTTNQIVTAANLTGLSLSLPATVHRDLQGNVTGNVQGDLTGTVTATSILADGVTATTQASSDSSEKVATTAYVKGLDNASDLDITGDTGTGDVNLNTQTLNILGTTNEITTAVVNQTATISLPSSISVDVIGNVTGALTGNADTATTWETARDLSLTGQATGTLSNVDGALAVSGAVTLDNNSVTAKVLTGLPTPAASSVLPTDSIVDGIGKLQSQINGLANGLRFMGSWNVTTNVPALSSGGGESASGTTTSTSADKLVDSAANFATVSVGDKVVNQVDGQTALVTNIDSATILSLDTDIMLSGEAYTIDISPFLTQGHYYVVSVGGARTLNGVTNWSVGDWAIVGANNEWTILDHTDVEGVGTPEYIPRWSAVGTIGDSIMVQGSNLITVNGTLSTTTNLNSGSNFAVATNKFTANATTGAVAFEGGLAINTDKFTVNATSGNTLVAGTITSPTFLGDLNGTINTLTTAATQSANNNSTKVATTAYVDAQAGFYLPLVGGTMTGDTIHNDNVKSIYGTASDGLEIYHDSTDSYINDTGTGNLRIRATNFRIESATLIHNFLIATESAGVQIFFNDLEKFKTTSTGVSVTGAVASTLTVAGAAYTANIAGASNIFSKYSNDSFSNNSYIGLVGNNGVIQSNNDVVLYSGASYTEGYRLDSSQNSIFAAAGTFGDAVRINGTTTTGLVISSASGSSNGLKLYNNSTTDNAYIYNHFSGNLEIGTNNATVLTMNGANSTFAGNVTISQPTNGSDAILSLISKSASGNSRTSTIEYDADNEYMYFKNAGTTVATMTSAGNVGIGGTGLYTTSHSLNIDGTGLAIKNNVNGSSNNWSHITNTDILSSSNLVFTTGSGVSLTLNSDKSATFGGNVAIGGAPVNQRMLSIYNSAGNNEIEFIGTAYTNIYSNTTSTMAIEVIGAGGDLKLATTGGSILIKDDGDVGISNGGSFSIGSATSEAKTQTETTGSVDSSGKIILTTISDGMSSATMSKVTIVGADNATSSFYDEIVVAANSTTINVLTTINRGAAPARTYSVVSNQLKLVMASLSFNVNVKSEAMGYPF